MKKLLFAAAAFAAGVSMADITSANVVGYQNHKMYGSGITWILSTFQDLNNTLEEQTLASFQVPKDAGFTSGDSIILEIWGSDGTLQGSYSFVDNDNAATWGLTKPGWYPLDLIQEWTATDDDLADNTIIPFGSGVIITSGEADSTVTFAGQVLGEKSYTVSGSAITWTGNATPVNLWLKDFALPSDAGFTSGDSIILEIWNESGSLDGSYSFLDADNAATWGLTKPGWYPLDLIQEWTATDDDCANDTVMIPSGKMVIITSGEADTTLTLPDPTKVTPPTAE